MVNCKDETSEKISFTTQSRRLPQASCTLVRRDLSIHIKVRTCIDGRALALMEERASLCQMSWQKLVRDDAAFHKLEYNTHADGLLLRPLTSST